MLSAGCLAGCGGSSDESAAQCHAAVASPVPTSRIFDGPPRVPTKGAYLGAFALSSPTFTQDAYISSTQQLETAICRRLAIVHSYLQWQKPFPVESEVDASHSGQILLLSWTGTDMAEMASGADDAEIRQVAAEIASLHTPVLLELRWEMERPNLASVVHSPATFIAGWDHTRAVFQQAGVTNASWVWCPTATGFAQGTAEAYYPGAAEVDWICTDAYPNPTGPVQSLQSELQPFLSWAGQQGKPLMLGEFGVPQSYSSDDRKSWLQDAATFIRHTPQIKAAVYFDYNPVGHHSDRDYWLEPGSSALAAFRDLANEPWFRPTLASSG